MSILFTPFNLGPLKVKNRFIFSACEDSSATETGSITRRIILKNRALAKGDIGLIISTHMSVHPLGRTRIRQLAIHEDAFVPGLQQLTENVHRAGGRIVFQLGHAGLQTTGKTIGLPPKGPSGPEPMNSEEIQTVITSFVAAARRAAKAGADGIQLHAAHGYLVGEFLSPFFNQRQDEWGGSAENRFRFLREIVSAIKGILPGHMALMVKLNYQDYTPQEGVTPDLAAVYARELTTLGVHGLEISCGTSSYSPWNMCRGNIPIQELLAGIPEEKKARAEIALKKLEGKFDWGEGYNLEGVRRLRAVTGQVPLISVGGWRTLTDMEKAVQEGSADFISLCRPFIRDPSLIRRFREGRTDRASCVNCNKCLAALANNIPVRCYHKRFNHQ